MLRAALCALLVVAATPLGAQEQKQPQAPGPAQTEVALALVLAVDASGSVSDDRFELQKQGYAAAFRNRQVLNSIRSLITQSIAVSMMRWTGPELHVQTVDWILVKDEVTVNALADAIEASKRQLFGGGTSISGAIDYSRLLLGASPFLGFRRVIDISGDGANNRGRAAMLARDEAVRDGISINGLPILALEPDLDRYYYDNVIGGPGAFMVPARSYDTFADAILKKLITEIAGLAPNMRTDVRFALPAGYSLARLPGRSGESLGIGIFLTYLVPTTLLFLPTVAKRLFAIRSARVRQIVRLVDPAPRWRILRRGRRDLLLEGLAIPRNRAASATARPGVHSTREITEPGDRPRRFSKAFHLSGRSAALVGASGAGPHHSAHSRIPMRSHRRSASSRFCWRRRSTDRHASQSDKRAGRTCSRIQAPACGCALDMALMAFGM